MPNKGSQTQKIPPNISVSDRRVRSAAGRYFDFAEYKILDHSACVRPSTKDGMPILREAINGANIFIASGGGGWGIMQCFYVGKKMKEIIYGK